MTTLVLLACRIGHPEAKDACLRAICRSALPSGYFSRFIEFMSPVTMNQHGANEFKALNNTGFKNIAFISLLFLGSDSTAESPSDAQNQVVAIGTICPTPTLPSNLQNATVMVLFVTFIFFYVAPFFELFFIFERKQALGIYSKTLANR